MNYYPLKIEQIRPLTAHSVEITFGIPANWSNIFSFKAGQYLHIRAHIAGEEVIRSYSICSNGQAQKLSIAVKKVPHGKFSSWATTQLAAGDTVEVTPPMGAFTLQEGEKNIALIGAGSGITPLRSILLEFLAKEEGKAVLILANKTPELAMYLQELLSLREKYAERFSLELCFSQSHQKNCYFGRIEPAMVQYLLGKKHALDFSGVYICTPSKLLKELHQPLSDTFGAAKVWAEMYQTSSNEEEKKVEKSGTTSLLVKYQGEEYHLEVSKEQTLLQSLLQAEIEVSYSCKGGICGSCMSTITHGEALMEKNQVLSEQEIAQGWVLCCQAYPTSDALTLDYDN